MDLIATLIDLFLHLDRHLGELIQATGGWIYALLFLVLFCETGLVVTPFLPGDSLLFAAGAFAAKGWVDVGLLFVLLAIAAIAGDTVNYWIGRKVGPKVFTRESSRLLNKKHLVRTQVFYEKHGGKTIILARFIPIIRTFAPFVAGIGQMSYGRFIAYNVVGGIAWIAICLFGGYLFGDLPFVQKNFSTVILAIVVISVMPAAVEILRERAKTRRAAAAHGAAED
ncbi:MAG TPA: DedA family protein [Myxococcales bacterium]|nr:DedA family protein [Myxococcales bacterium]